jgi:hypothetical protein
VLSGGGGDSNSDAVTTVAMGAAKFGNVQRVMLMAGLLCVTVMALMVKMELGLLLFNSLSLLSFCCIKRSGKF